MCLLVVDVVVFLETLLYPCFFMLMFIIIRFCLFFVVCFLCLFCVLYVCVIGFNGFFMFIFILLLLLRDSCLSLLFVGYIYYYVLLCRFCVHYYVH